MAEKKDLTGLFELSEDALNSEAPEFELNAGHAESGQGSGQGTETRSSPAFDKIDQFEDLAMEPASSDASLFTDRDMDPEIGEDLGASPSTGLGESTDASVAAPEEEGESATAKEPAVSAAPAGYPFSLLIEGPLTVREKEKLVDLISRENMGIREIDLEPQFQSNRVLIPRISEFAGILLVHALRGTHADMRLGPSEEIFATDATRLNAIDPTLPPPPAKPHGHHGHDAPSPTLLTPHPAENIPITTEAHLPEIEHPILIDTISASAALTTFAVEADQSQEYQKMTETLYKELKYKAYHRGASGVTHYKVQLTLLSSPSQYRLTATGLAVKNIEAGSISKDTGK